MYIPVDEIPLWERPLVRDIAKLLCGLIVLLVLVLTVLRPLVRGLLAAPRVYAPPALPGSPEAHAALPSGGGQVTGMATALDYEGQIAQARTLVTQDPARVAQVVKAWVGNDNE